MRFSFIVLLICGCLSLAAQPLAVQPETGSPGLDSARLDSLVTDSLYADSISKTQNYVLFDPSEILRNFNYAGQKTVYQEGKPIVKGERWMVIIILILPGFFALLKQLFDRQLAVIVHSFFSNRVLGNLNKEDNVFTSWPFLLLFMLFGFTMGLLVYLAAKQQQIHFKESGPEMFLSFSLIFLLLFALKILTLRFLGFFFQVQKAVHEYISILYLTYFNASLVFMPLVIAWVLAPPAYSKMFFVLSVILGLLVFGFQLVRAFINVVSQNRFSKFYLFLYFCTLEICPILILIKALGF